jgi:hypothetical protein
MALGDPFQILIILFLILLIPVVVIYWIVRLAVRHELKRNPIPTQSTSVGGMAVRKCATSDSVDDVRKKDLGFVSERPVPMLVC